MRCDHSTRVEMKTAPCYGWTTEGFPWHGCDLDPGHGVGRREVEHRCRCGHRWLSRGDL